MWVTKGELRFEKVGRGKGSRDYQIKTGESRFKWIKRVD
jgi:hypothetical protein